MTISIGKDKTAHMSFASSLSRCPIPFDTDRVSEVKEAFSDLAPELRDLVAGTAGCSPYLAGLIGREGEWLRAALSEDPNTVLEPLTAGLEDASAADLKPALRIAKRRMALFTALADLGGVWTLEQVTGALTDFADRATDLAIRALVSAQIDRGKLPGQGEADKGACGGLVMLAMGKGGAHELNYSSDIDLISLFDGTRYDDDQFDDARAILIRVTRNMAGLLSDVTGDGYVFRTDLRLRPDPSVTPVCLSMEAAERYYESVGRTWERAAHIKARPSAGDIAAGEAYLERLSPFIWRKHLDFAAIQDAHDMRLRIREHKGLFQKITLEGHNMKLGPGSIREIEFFTQTRQIIAGGRDPSLRLRQTVPALRALAGKGWIPEDVADQLIDNYRRFRDIEHRIQMVNDAQTHDLPNSPEGVARIAAMCGEDVSAFRADLEERLALVQEITEGFFAPGAATDAVSLSGELAETVDRWKSYPALRSARAVEVFERLKPELLKRLQKAANPTEAFREFDRFLVGLPAGVQVFSLFEANPVLIDLIVDIAATAPHLAAYLGRNSAVFDAVIGGDFFAPWPGAKALTEMLKGVLAAIDDYEGKLNAARRWQKEWHFRIGVHQLRGLIEATEAGAQYAGLADACVVALWPEVVAEFARKHGAQPGEGSVVIGMGSLGSERLTAASDLDLIMIYDAAGEDMSDGRRPLQTRVYYARLTQALVTALSAQTSEGRLYEVDMRLRPSGRQGPVATSIQSFETYQREEAWTWEHLALTRARTVAGNLELGQRVEAFRQELLNLPSDAAQVLADVQDMRERIAAAKPAKGDFEAKLGPGRMQDIELVAQAAALMTGYAGRAIPSQLRQARLMGWIDRDEATVMIDAYRLMWQLQSAARLLTGEVLDLEVIGEGGRDFLLRETAAASPAELADRLVDVSAAAEAVIKRALGSPPDLA